MKTNKNPGFINPVSLPVNPEKLKIRVKKQYPYVLRNKETVPTLVGFSAGTAQQHISR
jgi:hypothetical protein